MILLGIIIGINIGILIGLFVRVLWFINKIAKETK